MLPEFNENEISIKELVIRTAAFNSHISAVDSKRQFDNYNLK